MTAQTLLKSRAAGAALTLGIVALASTTAYVHLTLGGLLFLLNGLGYAGLTVLLIIGAMPLSPLAARFDWFPRLALIGFAAMTIAGYLVIGPYFALGWITKGVELALIALVMVDVIRVYGSLPAFGRRAIATLVGPDGLRPIPQRGPNPLAELPPGPADAPERA